MKTKQSLKIYELVKEQIPQPEKARDLTESIAKVISDSNEASHRISRSSLGKELEGLRKRLSNIFYAEIRAQRIAFIRWFAVLSVLLVIAIVMLYNSR